MFGSNEASAPFCVSDVLKSGNCLYGVRCFVLPTFVLSEFFALDDDQWMMKLISKYEMSSPSCALN